MENAVLLAVAPALNVMLDILKEEKGTANVADVKAVLQVLSEIAEKCNGDLATGHAVWHELMNVVLQHTSPESQD
ncbi:hypothetical protein [Klebsiella quasipneumoniae]|uniref:hypothetical protein n=1 Tax=Klebsiella quasipneumoniae TaxID=1463165 RepID=UPI0010827827|nr:hypothetical protein [Klebsiella quasipneumoniae]VGB39060.1 Uncharacterised protein [Klebsiella quasipneumoniae]VGB68875.1 Uncharacterised protein [Klebsiella quasipneumoniae]